GDFLSQHIGEVIDAVRAGWPFAAAAPTVPEAGHLVSRLFATPARLAGVAVVLIVVTAVVTLVHAIAGGAS
ncbi:hypothetical protein, partial [Dactylosporangium fulvum]